MNMLERLQFTGDIPQPRFGHTITLIDKHRAVLFGGAVGDTGKYVITGDTFLCEFLNKNYRKLDPKGVPPSNRAAHSSVFVDSCLFVFGGALGGGELADHHLYQLDMRAGEDNAVWSIKNQQNSSPGKRYGHVMAYIRPYLVVFGGNTGAEPVNDVWTFSLNDTNIWTKVTTGSEAPAPRVYHSASTCKTGSASGMLVVFGGRTTDQSALDDTWGLRKHRDGRLDWVKAPYKTGGEMPHARYQHSILFLDELMLVVGGRNNSIGQKLGFDIYNTETSEWCKLPPIQKFRHACWISESYLYIHGGFDQDSPNVPTEKILRMDLARAFQEDTALFKALSAGTGKDYYSGKAGKTLNHNNYNSGEKHQQLYLPQHNSIRHKGNYEYIKTVAPTGTANRAIRLCPEVIVGTYDEQTTKKVELDKLREQNRRLTKKEVPNIGNSKATLEKVYAPFINAYFLKQGTQAFNLETIHALLFEVEKLLVDEPTLSKLRVPLKVFGDLHGQLGDLNRLFETFGAPTDEMPLGDIEACDYLFLGDYVDRGSRSLELILLLFSLKLKYPQNVHLLRGGHEDKKINKSMGFGDECASKLKENIEESDSVFQRINRCFEKLPIAALVQRSILCVHGGIGTTLRTVDEIDSVNRPIEIQHEPRTTNQKITYQLLWSDPSEDAQNSMNLNHDYFKLKQNVRFGQNRINRFCSENGLIAIVRSNEPVVAGVSQTGSKVINVFSCLDYVGQNNSAGIVTIKRNQEIVPKILPTNPVREAGKWPTLEDFRKNRSHEDQLLRAQAATPPKR